MLVLLTEPPGRRIRQAPREHDTSPILARRSPLATCPPVASTSPRQFSHVRPLTGRCSSIHLRAFPAHQMTDKGPHKRRAAANEMRPQATRQQRWGGGHRGKNRQWGANTTHLVKAIERVDIIRDGVNSQPQWVFLCHLQCLRPGCTRSHHYSLPLYLASRQRPQPTRSPCYPLNKRQDSRLSRLFVNRAQGTGKHDAFDPCRR